MKDKNSSQGAGRQPPPEPVPAERGEHDRVYDALCKALFEGKLRPGTPLRERHLAEVFGVTRNAIRKVLLQLSQEGKLQIYANRGAYVPEPSSKDIREIYDARRAVEAGLVAVLAPRITAPQLARLKDHVKKERRALEQGRRDESVRLAGAFHTELVTFAANSALQEIVQRLVVRTQMYVALFESARDSGCAPHEHEAIIEALGKKDSARAVAAMMKHLHLVEERVAEHTQDKKSADVGLILGDIIKGNGAA
jgi:DNA-binding GntR family transcriptional regulator